MTQPTLAQIADAAAEVPQEKWPVRLAELVDLLVQDARRRGVDLETATAEATRTVLLIAQHEGGRPFYLPRGDSLVQALRDRQLYLRHNGRNTEELADQYGMTVRHVQRICAEQRALQLRRRQRPLFED